MTHLQGVPSYTDRTPTAPVDEFSSDSDDSQENDHDSLVNVPSSMDGDYHTHEPLDNDPVTFQNVLWEIPQYKKNKQHSTTAESVV